MQNTFITSQKIGSNNNMYKIKEMPQWFGSMFKTLLKIERS